MRQNITADPAGSNCRWPEAYKYSQKKIRKSLSRHSWPIRSNKYEKSRFWSFPFGLLTFSFFSLCCIWLLCVSALDKYLAKLIFDSIIIKAARAPKEYFMLRLSVILDWPDIKAHAAYAQFGSKTSLSAGNWIGIAENSNPLASKYLVGIWQ